MVAHVQVALLHGELRGQHQTVDDASQIAQKQHRQQHGNARRLRETAHVRLRRKPHDQQGEREASNQTEERSVLYLHDQRSYQHSAQYAHAKRRKLSRRPFPRTRHFRNQVAYGQTRETVGKGRTHVQVQVLQRVALGNVEPHVQVARHGHEEDRRQQHQHNHGQHPRPGIDESKQETCRAHSHERHDRRTQDGSLFDGAEVVRPGDAQKRRADARERPRCIHEGGAGEKVAEQAEAEPANAASPAVAGHRSLCVPILANRSENTWANTKHAASDAEPTTSGKRPATSVDASPAPCAAAKNSR